MKRQWNNAARVRPSRKEWYVAARVWLEREVETTLVRRMMTFVVRHPGQPLDGDFGWWSSLSDPTQIPITNLEGYAKPKSVTGTSNSAAVAAPIEE